MECFTLKFALVDFQCNKNGFTENFAGLRVRVRVSRMDFLATPIVSTSKVVTIDEAGNREFKIRYNG